MVRSTRLLLSCLERGSVVVGDGFAEVDRGERREDEGLERGDQADLEVEVRRVWADLNAAT